MILMNEVNELFRNCEFPTSAHMRSQNTRSRRTTELRSNSVRFVRNRKSDSVERRFRSKLILLGPPGSGKGTQAKKIEFRYGTKHLAAGDLLREEIVMSSEIGKKVESYVKGGRLAPDELIIELMKKSILKYENFILDGFPRNITQAKALEKITDIDLVLNIEVDEKIIIERLSGRRTCSTCNAIYHLSMAPSKKEDICDRCGGKLFQRADDKEAVIKKRLAVYKKETKPLIEYYKRSGKLETINGNGSVDEVFNEISSLLSSHFPCL